MTTEIDLPAYFARIRYTGRGQPTLAVLRDLHARHPAEIAFEGLDPLLGRPVAIDYASVQTKLVNSQRGGYCHEHNALFFGVLQAIGYRVTPLGGRVLWMAPGRSAPLTHRLTLVHLPEGDFLADVGFGGQSYTAPLRLKPDVEQDTAHGSYRVTERAGVHEAQMRLPDRWEAMYQFTLAPQSDADFEMANWFTSTHPKTRFTRNLLAARVVGSSRVNLLNTALSVRDAGGAVEQRTVSGPDELREVLEGTMGLRLPVPAKVIWDRLPAEMVPQWP
jgi:N-hydroxyarylamine O-acetyltransferase